jgi:hypothetical protein
LGAKTDLILWTGIASGPSAWALQMTIGYPIAQLTCRWGPGDHQFISLHAISVGALLVTAGGAWLLTHTSAAPNPRVRFMAHLGLLVCALFAVVIVAMWAPVFFLHDCAS